MRIGLIGDMAIGMDAGGSHAWSRQSDILLGLTIGAPPDLLNPRGQDWGLTGFSPRALEDHGFAPFIATLRASMRHVGGIRVDHAMGLSRLWLIPEGESPANGAYVNYPVADLLRLLALESVRHNVVVIGEDLGTVPEGFHDMLEQGGIHGMRVLWFERDAQSSFLPPRGWGNSAVAMTSTHDLPTVAGWWKGYDIDIRHEHGRLGDGVDPAAVREERDRDRPKLWNAFIREHVTEGPVPPPDDTAPVVDAALKFVAKTEVPLSLIPLEDLLGQQEQPNLPGTVSEHPNWRRRLPQSISSLLQEAPVARRIEFGRLRTAAPMTATISSRPRATMRLQLHKDFTFADAAELVPYLLQLGVSHVYSSPILTARKGSIHGYDVVDPTSVNPELGGEKGLRHFVSALRSAGLGLIVDIVPNHMAVGGSDNAWWTDVLRYGRASRYAKFFDINWESDDPELRGKILAPFLGKAYGDALDAGEIRVNQTPTGEPVINYFDNLFPIDPVEYAHMAECGLESFDPGNPSGRAQIHALLQRQHYRLAWWGTAGDEINWRRFFDINGLAGLRIEVPEVFEETHATLFRLYSEGLIDGFRVDHVDGLSDPPSYCRRLRQRLEELDPHRPANVPHGRAYIVVEKILGAGEPLARDWDIDGTSGYDFMNEVSALQHDQSASAELAGQWHTATSRPAEFEAEEVPARQEILQRGFDAPLQAVTMALHRIARANLTTRDISAAAIRRGLVALLSHYPVYRGYNEGEQRSTTDQKAFQKAVAAAKQSSPISSHFILDHLDRWLGGEQPDRMSRDARKMAGTLFHQLSAPVAAKSVEDTAFYRYGRLLSRNDVGFDAPRLGSSVGDFHNACLDRLATFPDAMLATATHDHKRGEDLRARLAVLSEIPHEWADFLTSARSLPADRRPDPGDEIMLYQMIVGAWPLTLDPTDASGCQEFVERLAGWQEKALREAKLRTDWTSPDQEYEATARKFLQGLFAENTRFLSLAKRFVDRIAPTGALNGLVQSVLKMTVPGMPDFFQGTDFWDFSLVDPDNRRPVDYGSRWTAMADGGEPAMLLPTWRDGRVKQSLIRSILTFRRHQPALFAEGEYIPLVINGELANRVVAFARTEGSHAAIIVAPRLACGLLSGDDSLRLDPARFGHSTLVIPDSLASRAMRSVLSNEEAFDPGTDIPLRRLWTQFPIAVLQSV